MVEFKVELIDCFGKLLDVVLNLFVIVELKFNVMCLKVCKIEVYECGGYVEFYFNVDINLVFLVKLL